MQASISVTVEREAERVKLCEWQVEDSCILLSGIDLDHRLQIAFRRLGRIIGVSRRTQAVRGF